MENYPFDLLQHDVAKDQKHRWLGARPFSKFSGGLREGAPAYQPSPELEIAIETALAVGNPLLLTGESGTGKTQAAYYVAQRLELGEPLHFQVKSTSQARDLLYNFDTVRYFRDAWPKAGATEAGATEAKTAAKTAADYVTPGFLWQALEAEGHPKVLLIDEIDKAPRDFPNDLLLELDEMKFRVPELDEPGRPAFWVRAQDPRWRPLVFITSNDERQLPAPFLRRCVFHHIDFTPELLERALRARLALLPDFSDEFLKLVVDRFLRIRAVASDRKPATGECLLWAQALAARCGCDPKALELPLKKLPYLSLLLKSRQALDDLEKQG